MRNIGWLVYGDLPAPIVIETREGAVIVHVNLKLFDDMHIDAINELIDQASDKPGVFVVVLDMSQGLKASRQVVDHDPAAIREALDGPGTGGLDLPRVPPCPI